MTKTTAIAEYSATEAALAELKEQYGATVWVVDTPDRMEGAKKARAEIRKWRTDLEKERKRIKAPALERCNAIDTEARRIKGELLQLEEPVDKAIKDVEQAEERAREEKARKEEERKVKCLAEIDRIRNVPVEKVSAPLEDIKAAAEELKALNLDWMEEFTGEAMDARDIAVTKLRAIFSEARARQEEEERLAAERAELERLRAAEEARQKEIQAKRDVEEKERREKLEAEEKAARDRIAAQEREAARKRDAEEKAAREAREAADAEARAIRAKADKEAREAREAEEKRLRAEREKAEAEQRAKEEWERAEREAAEAKEKEEREAMETEAREEKRKAMFLADGREMLQVFVHRYSDEPEFAPVIVAINHYLADG